MPVRSEGAASAGSSRVSEYSNSNPSTRMPPPMAKPRAGRAVGDVALPRNTVMSARA